MKRRLWKLWYRYVKWQRYWGYNRKLPEAGVFATQGHVVDTWQSPSGDIVSHVEPGLVSRPVPTPTNVTSDYAKRVCRSKDGRYLSAIDEDLEIHVNSHS